MVLSNWPARDGRGAETEPRAHSAPRDSTRRFNLIRWISTFGFIAEFLNLSVKTVEKHRSNLMSKLDVHNASGLTAYAIEKGLTVR